MMTLLGHLFGASEGGASDSAPASSTPVADCRRVLQVRHAERLSGIPRVLTLIAALGRAADFRVALPHVAGSSLVEATRAPSVDGAPRERPTMPLSAYLDIDPKSQAAHSACDALGRPAIELVFAKRDDPSVSIEAPAKWCPPHEGEQGPSMQICIFDWQPCDSNARKRAGSDRTFICPQFSASHKKKMAAPFALIAKVLRAAFDLMEQRYPPKRRPVAVSYVVHSIGKPAPRGGGYAPASAAPTLVIPSGQGWYKDIGGFVPNRTTPWVFQSVSHGLAKVVARIEKQRTGCKATGGVSAAAMFRLLRNGPNMRLVCRGNARAPPGVACRGRHEQCP